MPFYVYAFQNSESEAHQFIHVFNYVSEVFHTEIHRVDQFTRSRPLEKMRKTETHNIPIPLPIAPRTVTEVSSDTIGRP